jgi:hypothetical protein
VGKATVSRECATGDVLRIELAALMGKMKNGLS